MIKTLIGEYPDALSAEEVAFVHHENFGTFGRLLPDEELIAARFGYERMWEMHPYTPPQDADGKYAPGHRHLRLDEFLHEPDIMRLIANDYFLRIAGAILGVPETQLVYVAGYLHRQRCCKPWTYEDFGWPGWHQDAQPTLDLIDHINIWIYLDDCTRYEGVTQVLVGACELQRENLKAERPLDTGLYDLQDAQDSLEDGTWAEAPAGGGAVWGSFLSHRISPNLSGKSRRLITFEYKRADDPNVDETMFWKDLSAEQRQTVTDFLPQDKRYLVEQS